MSEPIQFIAPNGNGFSVSPNENVRVKVGDNEFSFSAQFLHTFCSKNMEADIPLLIEALRKEYPHIQTKVDLLEKGVILRNETVELLVGTDETAEKAMAREANLKNAKVKMDIYEDLTKINDTLASQISNIGGTANTEAGEGTVERSAAQNLLKGTLNQKPQ